MPDNEVQEKNLAAVETALKNRDCVVIIDKSGSMGDAQSASINKPRFEYAEEFATAVVREAAKHDPDGIDVIVFNNNPKAYNGVDMAALKQIFKENQPAGGTDLAPALKIAFDGWRTRKANNNLKNGTTILVVTDGLPNDGPAAKKMIIDITKEMDVDEQLAISFLQFGDDPGATKFLKELDDELVAQGAKFDIVDTKNADDIGNMTPEEILIAAVTD